MAARLTAYLVVAIVGATFIAGLIVGAQRDDNEGPVDLIVQNATVYTADPAGTMAEAVAVRGNQILRVGTNREIARLQRRQTVVVDARGGAVLPGFNDAHLRLPPSAILSGAIDLAGVSTVNEVLARVSAWSVAHPEKTWIVGRGWASEQFRSATPFRQVLDSVVGSRPVLLFGTDGSTTWANTAALQLAGITRATEDPTGGTVVREIRTGEPSGLLRGTASELVARQIPPPSRKERIEALRAAINEANAAGITSAQSTEDTPEALEIYDTLRRAGDLTVRVYSALAIEPLLTEGDLRHLERAKSQYADDPLFKAGAVSLRLDGAVTTRAAALLAPYAGPSDTAAPAGEVLFTPDDLNRTVRLADAAGWQIITRGSGDRAVRMALDAYAHAVRSNRPPARDRRHRIEGVTLVDRSDMPRFGALGVIASMQPAGAFLTPSGMELLGRQLGSARALRAHPFGSLAGETRIVFGSGWPASNMSPLLGLHAAINRTPPAGRLPGGWDAGQRLDLKQAIEAYTSAAAWASFDEQRKGSIVPGMLADLVVLSDDIFESPPDTLAATTVAFTIFDGKVVYRRPPAAGTE